MGFCVLTVAPAVAFLTGTAICRSAKHHPYLCLVIAGFMDDLPQAGVDFTTRVNYWNLVLRHRQG